MKKKVCKCEACEHIKFKKEHPRGFIHAWRNDPKYVHGVKQEFYYYGSRDAIMVMFIFFILVPILAFFIGHLCLYFG